ncbi:MFS transporter [Lapillicoccus sp.]|uniref:MFS transporter n=1 Tax=Lapillicoccus sp. TaxID=1909287 RepID=UPI003267774C
MEPVRQLRSIALSAYGPTALGAVGTGAVLPVVILSARALGAGVSTAAFLLSLIWVAQLVGDLPAGALAARIGERSGLTVACAIEAVGMVGCAFAPSLWVLAGSLALLGLASSLFGLARQAYLTDAVPIALRARALSTLGGVNRIGVFVGPFIGALVVSRWGIGAAYLVGFVSSLSAIVLVLLVPDITAAHRRERGVARRSLVSVLSEHRRTLLTLGVGALFIASARSCRIALIPLFAESIGLDAARTSLVVGIAGGVDMLLFYPAGGVMDRYGRMWVAVPSMVVLAVGMALLPLAHDFGTLTAVAVVLGVGNGIGAGLVMTLGADASPVDARVQFLGGWRVMADLGNASGPALISALTLVAPLAVAAVGMGGAALVGAGWLRLWVPRFDPVSRATLDRARPRS